MPKLRYCTTLSEKKKKTPHRKRENAIKLESLLFLYILKISSKLTIFPNYFGLYLQFVNLKISHAKVLKG